MIEGKKRKIRTKKCKIKPILCRLLVFFRVNSWLSWKNKPNFLWGQMSAKPYKIRRYEKYIGLDTWWKQTQTNPILFSPQISLGVETGFEKTKPICRRTNRRKVLFERRLWQYNGLWDSKKQSQFKANLLAFSVLSSAFWRNRVWTAWFRDGFGL